MGIFNQFFGSKKQTNKEEHSKYLPKQKPPVAVEFAQHFTQRGGKFIYCENDASIAYNFEQILIENRWTKADIGHSSSVLSSFFKLENPTQPSAFILQCESLIANKGSILICNRQLHDKKLNELPENLIIVATVNDFKSDVSEAMTSINHKYKDQLPSNITTLNAFDPTKENDFLSYGGNAKHIYLLIQEVNE